MIRFEWNQTKAAKNYRKHGVKFGEAVSVFYDENALVFFDTGNSGEEDRYLLLRLSESLRILLVSFKELEDGALIRIISARKATRNEYLHY